jgi:hypothetical protein
MRRISMGTNACLGCKYSGEDSPVCSSCEASCNFERREPCRELYDRVVYLLTAARNLLNKQNGSPYVLNLLEETVFYDDAICDGSCLLEEINRILEDVENYNFRGFC